MASGEVYHPRFLVRLIRWLLALFFRRIEVEGLENVPPAGGGVLVAWHPNGLLDPALILTHFPRPVVFGARHGLFSWPLLGPLLRALGTVPLFRPQDGAGRGDEAARRAANRRSLDALAEAVSGGSFAALFPEGVSHDQPHLEPLRPGAARLFLLARRRAAGTGAGPWLVPIGLHYDRKHLFGSNVLVEIHPPIEPPPGTASAPADAEAERRQAEALTARIEHQLTEVVGATESWELNEMMQRLRKAVRAERAARAGARPGRASVRERVLGFARIRRGYQARLASHPQEVAGLLGRVRRYGEELRALGLEDHDLDLRLDRGSPWRGTLLLAQALAVYVAVPPLLALGYLVNVPVAFLLGVAARRLGALRKDEATLKLLLGAIAFPAVWLAVSALVAWGQIHLHAAYPQVPEAPWPAAGVTFLLSSVGGWLALRYLRVVAATYHGLRVRLTRAHRRRAVERLRRERAELFEATMALAAGLELPGTVGADGRIAPDPRG